jgi:hypothetical protein
MNNESEGMWKEADVDSFEIGSWYLPGCTAENHVKPQLV